MTVTAHAGALGTEANTLPSVAAGLCCGAQCIEVDIRFRRDGIPVLSHDPFHLDGAPTLAEAFALAGSGTVGWNLDLKECGAFLADLPPLVEQYGLRDRVFFTGVGRNDIPAVRTLGIPYYLNCGFAFWFARRPSLLRPFAAEAKSLGVLGLNLPYRCASPQLVRAAHAAGLLVSVWTVNRSRTQARMARLGVDNMTTLRPDLALLLRKRRP
ncbi:MAG: glycerophosphodiester phosphodiesterase [Oscillospiraceae bacterium]|jgi:glycerophosphoryl diester phosphodiesterase|nr:glycerophosphodiester phosphodiesterase [Oscillospiraceae bacterium]